MLFALILVLQHLELPYGSHLSSVLSARQVPVEKNSSSRARDPSSNVNMVGNESIINRLDNTGTYPSHEIASNNKTSDLVSDGSKGSERTLEIDEDEDESGSLVKQNTTLSENNVKNLETDISQWGREPGNLVKDNSTDITLSKVRTENESSTTDPGGNSNAGFPTTPHAYPPVVVETDARAPIISVDSNVTLAERDQTPSPEKTENSEQLHGGLNETGKDSSVTRVPVVNKVPELSTLDVYTISDMNKLLHHSRTYHSVVCLKKVLLFVILKLINASALYSFLFPFLCCRYHNGLHQLTKRCKMQHHRLKMHPL